MLNDRLPQGKTLETMRSHKIILGGTNHWGEFHLLKRMAYFLLLWDGITLPARMESDAAASLIKAQISHCSPASFHICSHTAVLQCQL